MAVCLAFSHIEKQGQAKNQIIEIHFSMKKNSAFTQ